MARIVEFTKDALVIHLSGLTSVAALKRELSIPFESIVQVETHVPDLQSLIRLGGTAMGEIQEGHYWHGDGWYFLSYEHTDNVIALTLNDFHIGNRLYRVVAFGVDNPSEEKARIEARISHLQG